MRQSLLCLAPLVVTLLVACSGSSDEGGIEIKKAELACDKQKTDVTSRVREVCEGKATCTCDAGCWANGAFPTGCTSVDFTVTYEAAGRYHAHYSGHLGAAEVLTIEENGDASFR